MSGRGASMGRREAIRMVGAAGVSLALGGAFVREGLRRGRLTRSERTEPHLGTIVTITLVHPEAQAAARALEGAFAEIARLEAILSRYDPATPVARLNARGWLDTPPPEMLHVLRAAVGVAEASGGAFDPTVLPLLSLHARTYAYGGSGPDAAAVDRARALVDHRALRISDGRVALERPGMAITLDGIAKGWIVDRVIATLCAEGFEDVLVDAGGDIGTAGVGAMGAGWEVAIDAAADRGESPGMGGPSGALVRLRGEALATSGDAMRAFTLDRAAHHILDPRTGRSPRESSAVSVRASTAMEADALSTALMVLGERAGRELVGRLPSVRARFVDKAGRASEWVG